MSPILVRPSEMPAVLVRTMVGEADAPVSKSETARAKLFQTIAPVGVPAIEQSFRSSARDGPRRTGKMTTPRAKSSSGAGGGDRSTTQGRKRQTYVILRAPSPPPRALARRRVHDPRGAVALSPAPSRATLPRGRTLHALRRAVDALPPPRCTRASLAHNHPAPLRPQRMGRRMRAQGGRPVLRLLRVHLRGLQRCQRVRVVDLLVVAARAAAAPRPRRDSRRAP